MAPQRQPASGGNRRDAATLSPLERRTLERLVALLQGRLGDDLVSVWLYGSRARGERPHSESDVDVMVVTAGGAADSRLVSKLLFDAADREGANPFTFSIQVMDPDWIEGRRAIKSFYIQEVDRDKLVLAGRP